MSFSELSREKLTQLALEKGASANQLARQPTYAIVQLLEEQEEREKKRAQQYIKTASRSSKAKRATQRPFTATEQKELQAIQEAEHGDTFDDTETVVDMSHVVNTNNPTDEKYHRFIFLAKAKSDLVNAIKNNSTLVKAAQEVMEPDDMEAFHQNLMASQQKLKLVTGEMKRIHQWFNEVYQEKKQVYQQLLKEAVDLDGTLEHHFREKMNNIQKYIQSMAEQSHV